MNKAGIPPQIYENLYIGPCPFWECLIQKGHKQFCNEKVANLKYVLTIYIGTP